MEVEAGTRPGSE